MTFPSKRAVRPIAGAILTIASIVLVTPSAVGSGKPPRASTAIPMARADMAMAIDANGDVVMFGGWVAETDRYLADTWTWNGSNWTRRRVATSPEPRCCFQMAYDATHRQVVLYGGFGPNGQGWYFDDTWTWDGSTWTEQHPATNPPIAANYGMAYDARRKKVVMFVGEGLGTDSVWEWDGSDWTEVTPSTQPYWRELEGAAYDGTRRRVVMFGGEDCADICFVYDDTWVWDGVDWRERHPPVFPSQRSSMGLAYDAARRRVVMFGGNTHSTGFTDETWTWDGRTWTLEHPDSAPLARERMGLAWDEARRQIVMFGGRDFPDNNYRDLSDTWVWDGRDWTCVSNCH